MNNGNIYIGRLIYALLVYIYNYTIINIIINFMFIYIKWSHTILNYI